MYKKFQNLLENYKIIHFLRQGFFLSNIIRHFNITGKFLTGTET